MVVKFLDFLLGSLQMGAHLYYHVLVMNHQHPGTSTFTPEVFNMFFFL
jgi:hypothetical protein